MNIIHRNETVVLIGETGCGKSTQVSQFCVRMGHGENGFVGVTQPRRLAAVSLAHRVAWEMKSTLGQKVGYHVRFEKEMSVSTQIVYLTDGILLREAIHDPLLKAYNTIIVDEAHERSLNTDILLNILRLCQRQRKESNLRLLRIVIMSATLEAKLFSTYFNDAPVYVIRGRTFPVEVGLFIFHAELNSKNADYVYNTLVCIKDLHQEEPISDHFLVFLTGRDEIETVARKLRELNKHFTAPIYPVPLFAAMSATSQMKAFEPPPEYFASLRYNCNIGVFQTRSCHYSLYSIDSFQKLQPSSIPEVLRSNLATVLLEMLALGLRRPRKLKLIQQPDMDSLAAAEHELLVNFPVGLGAAVLDGKELRLTPIGQILCKFPLTPDQARVLMISNELSCLEEALTVIAAMSCETVFDQEGRGGAEDIEQARARQALACGLFMNVCEYDRGEDRYRLLVKPSTSLKIHPSSGLCRSRPRHIVFTDLVKTTDLYARLVFSFNARSCSKRR
ncbi:hypothetical protein ANCDUO_01902 [Ancylostoma duodenale]|uniref:RNA helicase n=1 Tax=Ancylostoma duodenale TaxID=51022 RepID=A0A0C2H1W6_9BILA|nr:hypothetical protein ANCDUO_01902 [Ancylostoma duodenale]